MAVPVLMTLFTDDAVEVRYQDQSCLQLSPCGSTFVHHDSPGQLVHQAHGNNCNIIQNKKLYISLLCLQIGLIRTSSGSAATLEHAFIDLTKRGPLWPWSYGSWIYNFPCNQCLSPLMLWVRISIRARCTTLCDKVCQWLATDRWFSLRPAVSSTTI